MEKNSSIDQSYRKSLMTNDDLKKISKLIFEKRRITRKRVVIKFGVDR